MTEVGRSPNEQFRDQDGTLQSLRNALRELQPTRAQWWLYSVSHGRFVLRLENEVTKVDLMIATLFAKDVRGPTNWRDPMLELDFEPQPGTTDLHENTWTVTDAANEFRLTAPILYWDWDKMYDDSGWYGFLPRPIPDSSL